MMRDMYNYQEIECGDIEFKNVQQKSQDRKRDKSNRYIDSNMGRDETMRWIRWRGNSFEWIERGNEIGVKMIKKQQQGKIIIGLM